MFWLIRKIFTLAVLAAIVFFALQFHFGGKSVSDYLNDALNYPPIQEMLEKAKKTADQFLPHYTDKLPGIEPKNNAPMDDVNDDEKKDLEKEIERSKH